MACFLENINITINIKFASLKTIKIMHYSTLCIYITVKYLYKHSSRIIIFSNFNCKFGSNSVVPIRIECKLKYLVHRIYIQELLTFAA